VPAIVEHAQGMPCWVDASVRSAQRREGLIDFYSALFGWSFDVDAPETGFYSIARHNGKAVLGIGEQSDGQGRWVIYFSTSDIERTIERVKANGGQVFSPPMQVMDVGQMALALDPTGAVHGLWQPITFAGFEVLYEPNAPGWFASFSHEDSANQPAQWTPVFVVDSLDRIRGRVRELGGTIIVEEVPVPGSAISIFQDPVVGNYVTVMRAGEDPNSGN